MNNLDLFIGWNRALFSYFFVDNTEDEEVSLYVDREKIEEIGTSNGLGGYDEFLSLIMLPIEDRQRLYTELRQTYLATRMSAEQGRLFRSTNLFDFAKIFVDSELYPYIDCPFLIYVVFVVLMGSEAYRNNRQAIGAYITNILRNNFPNHGDNRDSLEILFNELSRRHPVFCARKITQFPYVGLIRYQLGLSKTQVDQIKKALYSADISEDLPYEQQIGVLNDYVDNPMRELLRRSRQDIVLKRRISDLIENFDPLLYEQTHQTEEIVSKGHFVLAVYEDEYSEKNDRLVLLTDVNNKSLSGNGLKIEKGLMDRLGEYGQYNINHVLINNSDRAEMRIYHLNDGESCVHSVLLRNIVLFSRCSSRYLIQTDYPQRGNDTYILVRRGHQDEFDNWLAAQNNPAVTPYSDNDYINQVFGAGWSMYTSSEIVISPLRAAAANRDTVISMNGGIPCPGRYKVYQFNALPYFEFPEPINIERLSVYINLDDHNLDDDDFVIQVVDDTKLVIDLSHPTISDISQEMDITLEYRKNDDRKITYHDSIFICDQIMDYNQDNLLPLNLWGQVVSDEERTAYMKGYIVHNGQHSSLPESSLLYQPSNERLDIFDHRFFLVNLIASRSCMKDGMFITDNQLKKCMRYAVTRFGINIASDPNFFRDLKYMLINGGFINIDSENQRYQPLPPTFIKLPLYMFSNARLYMLLGSYTFKFLQDLKNYCDERNVRIFVHNSNQGNGVADLSQSILLPPVLLLQYNFDPEGFMRDKGVRCDFTYDEDVAVSMLRSIPSYQNYEASLEHVPANVFDTRLKESHDQRFPRIRNSVITGYGASRWIEMSQGDFYRISNRDMAWARLYCMYRHQDHMLTRSNSKISLAQKLHLPVMMQRALFIMNLGRPVRQKAFICNNRDSNEVYCNVIKVYNISNPDGRMPSVVQAISGRPDNPDNPAIRRKIHCNQYRLSLWCNRSKHSSYPRTLMVITDNLERTTFGFAIKTETGMKTYLRRSVGDEVFTLVEGNDMNRVISAFMTIPRTFADLGITFVNETAQLPPVDQYETENIIII
jgi:hypothetical protein